MPDLSLLAPAKLNLFLHITGRRSDGYHNLQTLFQLLDYGDQLEFSLRKDSQINIQPAIKGLPQEQNLIFKAAQALQSFTHCTRGADIFLHKHLPMGGGIGGGSSDAATTLVGLNHLWQTGLNTRQLLTIGQRLGADIPVFIQGKTAWAEGTGDQLQVIELPEKWYVVLCPDCHISTATIFSHKDLTRDTSDITVAAFLEQGGRNDCQPLVTALYPEVEKLVNWLGQFSPAQLTGTGACVFASFESAKAAREVFDRRPENIQGFVTKGINESPLYSLLHNAGNKNE